MRKKTPPKLRRIEAMIGKKNLTDAELDVILATKVTQAEFGDHMQISQQRVAELIRRGILTFDGDLGTWQREYIQNLQYIAEGQPCPLCSRRRS